MVRQMLMRLVGLGFGGFGYVHVLLTAFSVLPPLEDMFEVLESYKSRVAEH